MRKIELLGRLFPDCDPVVWLYALLPDRGVFGDA